MQSLWPRFSFFSLFW